ncbi:hypothetical protein BIGA_0024 [Bifidobacterium pullorum subsp. gallinarum]|uniref:DUF948 domain-containing protein n=4 Tax=Bifidobacterium pullorum TaxID=78448 RepID=A0A087ARW1_9BIFI|nr:hypothetical protein BIGA_0024 [Bifidobacterium pullorum subsp. gallinarum]
MGVGEIAGLIAAIAFAILAGFLIYPLIRLGKLFDQLAETVKQTGDHAIPALDESVTTVKQVNKSLEDVNKISSAASTTANNVGALTDLYGSFLGKPVIKVASTVYALKSTAQSFMSKRVMQQPNKGGVMVKRLFWIAVGVAIGIVAVSKAQAYVKANTPDSARQFLLGPDQDHVAVRTLEGLVNEFNATRRAREAELNERYIGRLR